MSRQESSQAPLQSYPKLISKVLSLVGSAKEQALPRSRHILLAEVEALSWPRQKVGAVS